VLYEAELRLHPRKTPAFVIDELDHAMQYKKAIHSITRQHLKQSAIRISRPFKSLDTLYGRAMHELEHLSLPLASRRAIVSQFWGVESAQSQKVESEGDPYFSYFERQCRDARQLDDAVRPVCTQHNICDIVEQLKTGETRENIREKLLQKATDDPFGVLDTRFFDLAIDLAVRLWLMVHAEYVYRGVTSQTSITWQSGTLNEALYGRFRHELILTDQIKLERVFNAMNIERIADVRIQWTPNLVDHLRFIEDGKTAVLNIFYHATFLKYHTDR
jgi:hypothetical protein